MMIRPRRSAALSVVPAGNSAVLDRPASCPRHARFGPDRAILGAILMPDINLTVWAADTRLPVPDDLDTLDDVGLSLGLHDAETILRDALIAAGYPTALIEEWAATLSGYARTLGDVADCSEVSIRLEVIESDACRKFHSDYVTVRLIATLAGPGTQWLDNDDAARLRAGADHETLRIRDIATGHVALFKGRTWAPDSAIVHRSPPIAGTGQRRLVLVIDPAPRPAPAV